MRGTRRSAFRRLSAEVSRFAVPPWAATIQNVRWQRGFRRKKIVVADFEGIVMLFNILFVLRLVGRDVSDLLPAGPPRQTVRCRPEAAVIFRARSRHGRMKTCGLASFPAPSDSKTNPNGRRGRPTGEPTPLRS